MRPRALVVCRHLGAASEVWLYRQVRALSRFDVEVVCWCRENEHSYPMPDIPVHVMPFEPNPEMGSGRWLYRLKNLRQQNFYGSVGAERRALERAVRKARPDVILCHYGHMALRVLSVAQRVRVPVVVHFHGIDISGGLRNPWYRRSLQRYLPAFAALVVVADYQRQQLLDLGADPRRVHVIPCGVPVGEIQQATELGRQPCRFLAVGRLVDKKGPLQTLRAFASCARSMPEATLTMIGDGPLHDALTALRHELRLERQVELWGNQPSSVVLRELQQASVFVQHSLTSHSGDMEGWPVAIAEAMAAGLPIVATRHAGILQQVAEGENGFLVKEDDWRAMGERMQRLAGDAALRERMGRCSRERAEALCDQQKLVQRLEGVMHGVALRAATRPPAPVAAGAAFLRRVGGGTAG